MTTADVGSAGELLVCADLLNKGFSVFRSVSATAPFDLVAYREGVCWRVEVKSGKADWISPMKWSVKCDIVSRVLDGVVYYKKARRSVLAPPSELREWPNDL